MSEYSVCTNEGMPMGLPIKWISFNLLMEELKVKELIILANFTDRENCQTCKLKMCKLFSLVPFRKVK